MLLVFSGILSVFFPLPMVLILEQLLIIVPTFVWIMVRHLPLLAGGRWNGYPPGKTIVAVFTWLQISLDQALDGQRA